MLIGIDEFLADRASKGPAERKAGEFVHYDAADLDVKFLLALLKANHTITHILCIPDFTLCGYGSNKGLQFATAESSQHTCSSSTEGKRLLVDIRAGVIVTGLAAGETAKLWMPTSAPAAIKRCEHSRRMIVCNLGLYRTSGLVVGHANALLFDAERHVIERYEPTGDSNRKIDTTIEGLLHKEFPKWTYIGTRHAAPKRGPQLIADAFRGLCVTYSIMYILFRLLNPDAGPKSIQTHIVALPALRQTALRLNRFVIDELRKHPKGSLVRGRMHPRRSRVITCRTLKRRLSEESKRIVSKPRAHSASIRN